ncbi:hypothetical protein OESDEN_19351, partial [Oesophagostomum dentatum]
MSCQIDISIKKIGIDWYKTFGTTVSVPTQAIPLTSSPSGSQSNSEPGYLPDYQGDRYTDPGRIKATQDLNKPFFDTLGYRPAVPRETPAQSGQSSQTGGQYTQ